jgi:hypothetical protein
LWGVPGLGAFMQVTLQLNDIQMKASRLKAAEDQLQAMQEAHVQEARCLNEQLQEAKDRSTQARANELAARREMEEAQRQAEEGKAACARAEAAQQQLKQQHEALQAEHAALKQQVAGLWGARGSCCMCQGGWRRPNLFLQSPPQAPDLLDKAESFAGACRPRGRLGEGLAQRSRRRRGWRSPTRRPGRTHRRSKHASPRPRKRSRPPRRTRA